jgi:hypothetical protein
MSSYETAKNNHRSTGTHLLFHISYNEFRLIAASTAYIRKNFLILLRFFHRISRSNKSPPRYTIFWAHQCNKALHYFFPHEPGSTAQSPTNAATKHCSTHIKSKNCENIHRRIAKETPSQTPQQTIWIHISETTSAAPIKAPNKNRCSANKTNAATCRTPAYYIQSKITNKLPMSQY